MEKILSSNEIELGKEQTVENEKAILKGLNIFLQEKNKYEILKEKALEAENKEEYEEKSKELEKIKNGLIEYSLHLKKEFFPELELNEIYTYDQIEEMKNKIKNKILEKKGIYPN